MFYTFNQNNSGGSFDYDEKRGISHFVIVEAPDHNQANRIAQGIGLYFDGSGDCQCCGNRWYPADYYEAKESPEVYGGPALAYRGGWDTKWINGFEGFIHYLDGTVVGFFKGDRRA